MSKVDMDSVINKIIVITISQGLFMMKSISIPTISFFRYIYFSLLKAPAISPLAKYEFHFLKELATNTYSITEQKKNGKQQTKGNTRIGVFSIIL
jgi:hypothetical protein